MKALPLAALVAVLSTTPVLVSTASADVVTLTSPGQGAALHTDRLAMSLYYVAAPDGGFEVVATYTGDATGGQPSRIVMTLADGDRPRFGIPGYIGTLFEFARSGDVVTVSDEIVTDGRLGKVSSISQ